MPNIRIILLILFLTFLAVVLGYNYFYRPFADLAYEINQSLSPSPSPTVSPSSLELSQVESWSPRQKILQLIAVPLTLADEKSPTSASPSSKVATTMSWITTQNPGVITIFGDNIAAAQVTELSSHLKNATQLQPALAVDHEGGSVQRLSGTGFTALPAWQTLCAAPDAQRQEMIRMSATELYEAGIRIVFAPVVDTAPSNSVLRNRICSAQPATVSARATEFVQVMEGEGVLPVIKHFPGIGTTKKDLHRTFDQITLVPEEVAAFAEILGHHPRAGVMTTHVGITDLDPTIPCSLNRECVREITSNYPEALVFTDALEMEAARYIASAPDREATPSAISAQPTVAGLKKSLAQVSREALLAGNDVLVFGPGVSTDELDVIIDSLATEYDINPELQKQVNDSVVRVLTHKQRWKELP